MYVILFDSRTAPQTASYCNLPSQQSQIPSKSLASHPWHGSRCELRDERPSNSICERTHAVEGFGTETFWPRLWTFLFGSASTVTWFNCSPQIAPTPSPHPNTRDTAHSESSRATYRVVRRFIDFEERLVARVRRRATLAVPCIVPALAAALNNEGAVTPCPVGCRVHRCPSASRALTLPRTHSQYARHVTPEL